MQSKFTVKSKDFNNVEDLVKKCSMKTDKTRHTIAVNGATVKDLQFVLEDCTIKYKPTKFDKLVVIIPEQAVSGFAELKKIMFEDTEPFVRDSVMNIKTKGEKQLEVNKNFSVGDSCKLLIKFSAVWTISGKHYATFELIDIKKLERPAFVEDW